MATVPVISLQDATKGYGEAPLFTNLTLVIAEGERLALIGSNGSGKSTLLKVLAGILELDSGRVNVAKGVRCAYVSQEDVFPEELSAVEIVDTYLMERGFDHSEIARRSSMYLGLAGFEGGHDKVSALSGGWRKRLSIACALAEEPDCLLLDEPTNHLDIESIKWLEGVLAELSCPIVFVSHDRYFIERLATRVLEVNRMYPRDHVVSEGGYADYIENRELIVGQLKQRRESLENKVRREVEWLRQGVKARTTKSRARINEAHRLIDELRGSTINSRAGVELEFASTHRKTKELLKAERISQSMGGSTLFDDVSFILSPGSRLAIVGPNGSGKTTLVRTLLGDLPPQKGRVTRAPNLHVSFMDQARSQIQEAVSLREFLCPHGDSIVFQGEPIHVAAWAARFLFSHDHLSRQLAALSGGEKARAILAKSMAQQADILVFDEPTNDLDIQTLENLEDGFSSFPGAIVLITHDRYLLDRTESVVLGLSGGKAQLFGSFAQWDAFHSTQVNGQQLCKSRGSKTSSPAPKPPPAGSPKRLSYKDARELGMIEGMIGEAERLVEETQRQLDSGEFASDAEALSRLCRLLTSQQAEVERLYHRWQELETLSKL